MFDLAIDPKLSKEDFYAELLEQITAVIAGQTNWVFLTWSLRKLVIDSF